jgi:flagellar protein FlaJ
MVNSLLISLFLKFSKLIHPRILPLFRGIQKNLVKAGMRISFKVYLGFMTFVSIVYGTTVFTVILLLSTSFRFTILDPLSLAVILGVGSALSSMAICYLVPMYVSYSRGRNIDASLPMISNFMSVLASSGMPPSKIVQSLARVGDDFNVGEETGGIIRDMELMGMDLRATLNEASQRSPSSKFASLLDGMISTSYMGGDLAEYLRDQSNKYKNMRILAMKGFTDNLGVVAEVYVSLMVAAPLMLIVMLSVLSFLGGGIGVGGMDPKMILNILTFMVIPVGVCVLILAVESLTPQR